MIAAHFTFAAATAMISEREVDICKVLRSAGATQCVSSGPPSDIVHYIEGHIANPDNYEEGEPRPSHATFQKLIDLIQEAKSINLSLRLPKVSTYYGEIDLTWETSRRMLRVISYPGDRLSQIYVWDKVESPIPSGSMRDANATALVEELAKVYSHHTISI